MTPDMKRLCEAVEKAAMTHDWGMTEEQKAEIVVRAVLMALREPSEAMEGAARANVPNDFERWAPATEFATMIDAILADPVKA